ncbi:MAG: nitroreductase family protein [Anaerolineales bacterium]|nr:nitroreductase family protein [Anaerolineales bacterium]
MELWDALKRRRSVREFDTERDVPPEMVLQLLEAAILAPTAGDRQPWHFVIVREAKLRQAVARTALRQGFIATAPVMVIVCGEPGRSGARWGTLLADVHTIQDTAAAAQNLLLAATDAGLDSCWVSALREDELSKLLKLPEALRPLIIIPLGYTLRRPGSRPPRRPVAQVSTFMG